LLNQSLLTIVEGIEGGRKVFANTVKYIKATLTSNFGNFYAVAISSLFIPFLPMLPIQILLVNMLSDFPMISIATDKVDAEELTSPKQYDIKDVAVSSTILGLVSTCFDFLTFALFFRLAPSVLQTNWFMESILTELVLIYSIRSKRSMFKAGRPSKTILILTVFAALITVIIPFTSFGHKTFSFVTPSLTHVLTIIAIVVCYLITTEVAKVALFKVRRHSAK
nr:cation transporting ATPase C-terminal domain-containing protein [Candidatus Woesebacteria bacterium]